MKNMKTPNYYYFEDSLKNLNFAFKYTGLILETNKKKYSDILTYRFLHIFNLSWLNTDVFSQILFTYNCINENKGFLTLTLNIPLVTIAILANTKAVAHFIYDNDTNKLIEDIRSLELRKNNKLNINIAEEADKDKIYKNETIFLKFTVNALNVAVIATVLSFVVMPFIKMAHKYYKTKEIELILMFFAVYPIDAYNPKYYFFAMIHQLWTACTCLKFIASVDSLFYTCCVYIRIQFKLLQYDFEHLVPPRNVSRGRLRENATLRRNFKDLVVRHQKLIKCVDLMEHIYSPSLLVNFFTSSFLICLAAFIVSVSDDAQIFISFGSFLFLSTFQVFFVCLFGDMIKRSSIDLTDKVFNCLWYHTDSRFAKKILMVQMRAQKPCKLTANGFLDVTLVAFTQILSKSWSIFALLRTVYKSHINKNLL